MEPRKSPEYRGGQVARRSEAAYRELRFPRGYLKILTCAACAGGEFEFGDNEPAAAGLKVYARNGNSLSLSLSRGADELFLVLLRKEGVRFICVYAHPEKCLEEIL